MRSCVHIKCPFWGGMNMIVMICVDDSMGLLFNHRRQSQDSALRNRIQQKTRGQKLWMNSYSARQFGETASVCISESFLAQAGPKDFCFVENQHLSSYEAQIDQLILYKWNRSYPADFYFDISLSEHGWHLVSTEKFPGSSHEKITEEVYTR